MSPFSLGLLGADRREISGAGYCRQPIGYRVQDGFLLIGGPEKVTFRRTWKAPPKPTPWPDKREERWRVYSWAVYLEDTLIGRLPMEPQVIIRGGSLTAAMSTGYVLRLDLVGLGAGR